MSYSPKTGLVYIPIHEMFWAYSRAPEFKQVPWAFNAGHNPDAEMPPEAATAPATGALLAWDPVQQKAAWRVELGKAWNGGVLTTAGGLVVQGTADGRFAIYRAATGEKLWEMPIDTGAVAGPVSYMVDSEQYIAVAAGWGGAMVLMGGGIGNVHRTPARVLAFRLGGTAALPAAPAEPVMPEPPPLEAPAETVERGRKLYMAHCGNCHGFDAISGGTIPDLRYLPRETHAVFADVVLGRTRLANGMPDFSDTLERADVEAIHAYVVHRAHETYAP
jgi:quinohemoprotein ethanol dehydrogenase